MGDVMTKVTTAPRGRTNELALDIEVDGGIDLTTAPVAVRAGANVLVAARRSSRDPTRSKRRAHFERRRSRDVDDGLER